MNQYAYNGTISPSGNRLIFTRCDLLVATDFMRVEHGGRGDYVEFSEEQICKFNLFVPSDQEWRFTSSNAYYEEYRTKCDMRAKVYHQKKTVFYANYHIGYWYISPVFLKDFVVDKKEGEV